MQKVLPVLFNFLEKSPILAALFLPLLFLPITTEFYETTKIAFLIIFAVVLFLIWSIKMVVEKRVSFVRSPFDLVLAGLTLTMILVTIFSPSPFLSLTGAYLRFQPSLTFVLVLILYFYIFSTNLKDQTVREKTVLAFVLSVSLASLLAILFFLGISEFIPAAISLPNYLKSRAFNTLGSVSGLSLLSGVAFVLGLSLKVHWLAGVSRAAAAARQLPPFLNAALDLALYPLLTLVIAYQRPLGWLALLSGLGFLVILQSDSLTKLKKILLPLAFWAAVVFVTILTPQLSERLKIVRPQEIILGLDPSWQITAQTLTARPLFGGGLGRFPQLFTSLKPLSFNNDPNWNLRFDRPFNEPLLYLSETGILGLAAFLFLLFRLVVFVFNSKSASPLTSGLGSSLLTLSLAYFFTTSTSLHNFFLVLFLALGVSLEEASGSKLTERVVLTVAAIKDKILKLSSLEAEMTPLFKGATQMLPYFVLTLAVLLTLLALPAVSLAYLGEYFNRQALESILRDDGKGAYENQVKAVSYNPNLDIYQRNLAQISLAIAANISSRPQVSEADRRTIQALIQEAVRRARIASEVLQPSSVANWETRAQVYQNLIGVAQNADAWTVDSYARAINLEPTNPNLRVLLGGIYLSLENFEPAFSSFSQAVNLKSDHANAHYNLAQALIKLNRQDEAVAQYDIVLNLIGPGSPDYEKTKKERQDLVSATSGKAGRVQETLPTGRKLPEATESSVLKVPAPTTRIQKEQVIPPINLGTPKPATPSALP